MIASLFDADSSFGLHLKGYESRIEQQEMAETVWQALSKEQIALIEAGTGTGKSLAYLIPAILWATQNNERIVISTNTIALQEQLIQKDIPLALQVLGSEIAFVRALGVSNFICLQRLEKEINVVSLFDDGDRNELIAIDTFARSTATGLKSDLPFYPPSATWEKVSVDPHACTHNKCPHFAKCFLFKAKKEAQEAKIIVVNHHLLLSDLSLKIGSIIPSYKRLILDEAHHLEDIACEHFAKKASRLSIMKTLSDMSQLPLPEELSQLRKTALAQTALSFDAVENLFKQGEQKLRILERHREEPYWKTVLAVRIENLLQTVSSLSTSVAKLEKELQEGSKAALQPLASSVHSRLLAFESNLKTFIQTTNLVYWIQAEYKDVQLVSASCDVAQMLKTSLFEQLATTVMCSATLTANKSFSYIKKRLGLHEPVEKMYNSPFDYQSQVLLGIPQDMPLPDSPDFVKASHKAIKECIEASRGNAFVLFTSFDALKKASDALFTSFQEQGFHPMKQGDDHRHALITRFKETPRSILFATDSFWEGVDVVGDALRLVIITKLPFHVPTDPLSEARCEEITKEGRSAFFDYSLPRASVKLKQAFGRLIRHKNDRGACILLDIRLLKKGYGKFLLNSLPDCQEAFLPLPELKKEMISFYRKSSS